MTRARHDAALSQEASRASDEQCRATLRRAWDHADWRPRASDEPPRCPYCGEVMAGKYRCPCRAMEGKS